MLWDLTLTCSIVEWLVDRIDAGNNFISLIKGMTEVMMVFGSGEFSCIMIRALFGEVNSKLIFYKISN
jgi:hypothetical protein